MEIRKKKVSPSQRGQGILSLDKVTLQRLYAEHFPSVQHLIIQNSGSEEEAKDIFQEALIAVWLNVSKGKFSGSQSSLGGYIFTIAKHKWLDKLKSKSYRSTMRLVTEDVEEVTSEELDSFNEDIEYLNELYSQLDEKCQLMLKKFYFEKKSLRDIALEMGTDEGSIRTMKYRCMMKLRKMHLSKKGSRTNE